MKIVFITHYFPPLNSSGARRINAFAKYLAAKGHQITVITTRKTGRDGLLTEDIPPYLTLLELGGWGKLAGSEPITNAAVTNQRTVSTRSFVGQILLKIKRSIMKVAGQLIDHRLLFATQFAFPWLAGEVKNTIRKADIVMTSCPPWPTHLAGRLVKNRFSKLWVADYRDQFSGNHILRGSAVSRSIEVWLERWLINTADHIVAISEPMKEYYELFHPDVTCIENGYDEGVFEQARALIRDEAIQNLGDEFIIRYMGTITADRIPMVFFEALAQVNQQPGRRVIAEFYGESTLLRKVLPETMPQAEPFVRFCPQLPYMGAIQGMLTADALFFIETSDFSSHSARGVLTTKLFEYLAARRPVVAEITERSLVAQYIKQSGLGVVVSEKTEDILQGLQSLRANTFKPTINDLFINSLSRQVKAQELEQLLQRLASKTQEAVP
jgi:glycosyltransferase involved in cell wall biosynthesis